MTSSCTYDHAQLEDKPWCPECGERAPNPDEAYFYALWIKEKYSMKGSILWFDKRDGNGIAVGEDGLEYYIDTSAIPSWAHVHLNNKVRVEMTLNESITHVRCARVSWVNLQDALDRYEATLTKLRAIGPNQLRPDAIPELEALAQDVRDQFAEESEQEACTHSDDFECGHCIDCGEYVQNARHR